MGGGAPALSQHGQAEAAMSACRIRTRFPARHATTTASVGTPPGVGPPSSKSQLWAALVCRSAMPRAAAPPPLSGAHHTEQAALYAHARCHAVHVVFDALSGNATPPSDVDRSCHCQSLAHITGRHRCHICTGTRPHPATSAPGLGSALPHLHRDCAQAIRREDQLVHGPHQGNQNPMGAPPLRTLRLP